MTKHERLLIKTGFTLATIMVVYGFTNIIINLLLQ